jgi:uncharacterized protein YndB with AHSA1/START domain
MTKSTKKEGTKTKTTTTAKAPAAPPPFPEGKPTKVGQSTMTLRRGKTVTLEIVRKLKAPPERVYHAFIDPDAMAKWLPPHGFTGRVHAIDARVGGSYRMSFSTLGGKWTHFFGGIYKELVPGKRIVHTDKFEDPAMGDSEMLVTVDLKAVPGGTEVRIRQEGIPAGPAADGAPYGWSQSLDNLANLVEAELPF